MRRQHLHAGWRLAAHVHILSLIVLILTNNPSHAHACRWLPGAPNAPRRSDVFVPFLDGLRRCAGMYLAELQGIIMLHVLLVGYDVRVTMPPTPPASAVVNTLGAASAEAVDASLGGVGGPVHSAIMSDGRGGFKLRMRADMFSAFDGKIPYAMATAQ